MTLEEMLDRAVALGYRPSIEGSLTMGWECGLRRYDNQGRVLDKHIAEGETHRDAVSKGLEMAERHQEGKPWHQ